MRDQKTCPGWGSNSRPSDFWAILIMRLTRCLLRYRGHGECSVVLPGCCSEREWCELRHNCIRQDNCVESECYDGMQNVLWRNKKWLSSEQNAWRHAKRRLCTAFSRIEKDMTPTWFEHAAFWFLSTDIELESDALPLRHGVNRCCER